MGRGAPCNTAWPAKARRRSCRRTSSTLARFLISGQRERPVRGCPFAKGNPIRFPNPAAARRRPLRHALVQGRVKALDFLTRQEADEPRTWISPQASRRIRLDVAPRDRKIHNLPERQQRRVRPGGRCRAVCVEPVRDATPVGGAAPIRNSAGVAGSAPSLRRLSSTVRSDCKPHASTRPRQVPRTTTSSGEVARRPND